MSLIPTVLRNRDFRAVWLASLASNAGSWLQVVASGWLVYQLTDSPAAVGLLALVTRGPSFLFAPYAGQLADRFDRRLVGMWTFLLQGAAAAALTVLSLMGHAGVASLYILNFLVGTGFALGLPAMLVLIPTLVEKSRLSQAVSLNAAGINVARLVGPAVGGALLATSGPTACFALNAVSFLALVWVLWRLPATRAEGERRRAPMREALGYARRDPAMRRLLVGMTVFTMLAAPVQELAPVVAARIGAGPQGLGLLLGAMGGGALMGAWLLERLGGAGLPRHRALPIAMVSFAGGLALVAVAPLLWLGMVAMAFSGAFWIWMFAGTNTAIQLRAPLPLLGRMIGLYQMSVVAPIALGSLIVGVVAERTGIVPALLGCAVLLGSYGAWALWRPVREIDEHRVDPAPAPA
ncbi:MAG: MFS transporter [Miltoncostaeaceae bacterium]